MVEAVAALVGTITLVLQRRDRREDQAVSAAVLRRAVLGLYDRAVGWARLAEHLRDAVHAWREAGCPLDSDFGTVERAGAKMRAVDAYASRDRNLQLVLQVYAPESQDLDRLAERSSRNLRQLADQLRQARESGPEAVDEVIRQFDARTDEVLRGVADLRALIADRFPVQ
ncbi:MULTISPECIES: hypothetical protein [unclassified Blastococcus]